MRDHPWIYAVLAVMLSVMPFLLAPRGRWGRAFLAYMLFGVGFLRRPCLLVTGSDASCASARMKRRTPLGTIIP